MTRQAPGRRRATPGGVDAYDAAVRAPRLPTATLQRAASGLWLVAWLVGTLLSATALVDLGWSASWARLGAAMLCVVFVVALTHRCGGHLRIWGVMALALSVAALVVERQLLVTAALILTAVAGSVLAVLITRPATRALSALGEVGIAVGVAANTMIAVAAWNATVHADQLRLVVVMMSVTLIMGVIWNLGANLHGLERKGVWILIGVAAGIVVLISYATAVRLYGSEMLVTTIEDVRNWFYLRIGGAPRPTIFAVGVPALIVGVSMRSQRREGWWVTAFGVIGTVAIATVIVNPDALPVSMMRSVAYSVVLGLGVGLVLRRLLVGGPGGGSRSARAFETRDRQEPARTRPLQ